MFTKFPTSLTAGTVRINNTSTKEDKMISVYVANKDSVPMKIPAGAAIDITTQSAGETFMYLNQADDELTIELI